MTQEITLNEQQQVALETLSEFTKGDKTVATLVGSAGTGKTTLVKQLMSQIDGRIAVSAPTHKAKRIIEKMTGKPAYTIQALCGLRPNVSVEHFDYNSPMFEMVAEPRIKGNKVVFIDECSMVNKSLDEFIKMQAKNYGVKIIYIGDELQLPPIKEKISLSFTKADVIAKLTTVVRQAHEHPITGVLVMLREDIVNGTNNAIKYMMAYPYMMEGDKGYQVLNSYDFLDKASIYANASEEFGLKDYYKVLSYRNDAGSYYNNIIRKNITTIDATEILSVNETMMGYRPVTEGKGANMVIKLVNSEEYRLTELVPEKTDAGINVFRTKLQSLESEFNTTLSIVRPDSYSLFVSTFNNLMAKGLKGSWGGYYRFKESHVIMKKLDNSGGRWYKGKPDFFNRDIDHGYACTIHKSQGSTYANVFVDLDDIMVQFDEVERKKLLYVALSRATDMIYIKSSQVR